MSREQQAVAGARRAFQTGRSRCLEHRVRQLKNLQRLLTECRGDIACAMKKDLRKVVKRRRRPHSLFDTMAIFARAD